MTRTLHAAAEGDATASDELLQALYDELRALARVRLSREPAGQTLQATALVHEAYLRLVGDPDLEWHGRGHFFAAAATAMRRILIDRARKRGTRKRGGDRRRLDLDRLEIGDEDRDPEDWEQLDAVLRRLEAIDPRKAQIVMLRFFSGLTIEQTGHALGLSRTVIKDEWQFARAWLQAELSRDDDRDA